MAYKQEPGGGPKMKTGAGIPSVLLQSTDEKKGKKDPKDNVINKQFDLVQSRFPNHTVQRSKRNFGSYQVSSNESMGGSFEYTPGKRVKKLSSNSKSTDK
jgi:hypothetical protein